MKIRFHKYHGLGNDYIVLDTNEIPGYLSKEQIRLICHRNYGVGSDGILFGPISKDKGSFRLKIFNPDGSEAEKSGNGLRIFSRYLWDTGRVKSEPFKILTKAGPVQAQVHDRGKIITVEMGQVSFKSQDIPVAGEPREVLNEEIAVLDRTFRYCAATIGNPHCVILCDKPSEEQALRYGPAIENDSRFPNRTNVQFMKIVDRNNIYIEIWERGAGYTLASGSSSCAAASVAYRMDFCDKQVKVHMPGGVLKVAIGEDYAITMTGPVTKICDGITSDGLFSQVIT